LDDDKYQWINVSLAKERHSRSGKFQSSVDQMEIGKTLDRKGSAGTVG
jgi:hypothetical protein